MNESSNDFLLVQSLLRKAAYPHPVNAIRLIETHLSWVFLTGDYVYKVKKPLRYPFVDFSTLALRKHFCEEELRLNQRFNTKLYIDVVPIVARKNKRVFIVDRAEQDTILDWAVKMRQFDSSAQADMLLANSQLTTKEMQHFGGQLAAQHMVLPRSEAPYDPAAPIKDNFASLKTAQLEHNLQEKLAAIETHANNLLATSRQALQERHLAGFVRECHGDLHLSNIVRLEGELCAFDCLEFNPSLSTIDTTNDLAFLFMDCNVRQRPDLAYAFLDGYLDNSGDYAGAELLTLFASYRSTVRAKVAALRLEQTPADSATLDKLETHLTWAYKLAERRVGNIFLMHGFSGSGKSYWAAQLVPMLGAIRIRSDVLRKQLAGIAPQQRLSPGVGNAIYSATSSDIVYDAMAAHTRALVENGETVIIDATNLRFAQRKLFYDLAESLGTKCQVISLTANEEVLLQRIKQRATRNDDPSDANADVLAWQQTQADPLEPSEPAVQCDTTNASLDTLLDALGMSD